MQQGFEFIFEPRE